jgi:CRISPR/Cas system endoribonuclease Cas6 (RAMP superfamily)
MDYSQLPAEENSPWNTSPQTPNRSGFAASASGSEPPSPARFGDGFAPQGGGGRRELFGEASVQDSSNPDVGPQTPSQGTNGHVAASDSQLGGSGTQHEYAGHTEEQQQAPRSQQPYTQQQQPQYNQQAGQQGGRPQAARYQSGARTAQRHAPQYKLQTKVTALERTGKKDIILRFDAQVIIHSCRSNGSLLTRA